MISSKFFWYKVSCEHPWFASDYCLKSSLIVWASESDNFIEIFPITLLFHAWHRVLIFSICCKLWLMIGNFNSRKINRNKEISYHVIWIFKRKKGWSITLEFNILNIPKSLPNVYWVHRPAFLTVAQHWQMANGIDRPFVMFRCCWMLLAICLQVHKEIQNRGIPKSFL